MKPYSFCSILCSGRGQLHTILPLWKLGLAVSHLQNEMLNEVCLELFGGLVSRVHFIFEISVKQFLEFDLDIFHV